MTSGSQHTANRRNAARSTGPKTRQGKANSSGNARSHGLTAPVPMAEIQKYLDAICGNSDTNLMTDSILEATDPTALRLAEAEAHLHRCRIAERAHQDLIFERAMDRTSPFRTTPKVRFERDPFDIEVGKMLHDDSEQPYDSDLKSTLRLLIRRSEARPARLHNKANTLQRYRREAEARRRKALRTWLKSQNPETKPIST